MQFKYMSKCTQMLKKKRKQITIYKCILQLFTTITYIHTKRNEIYINVIIQQNKNQMKTSNLIESIDIYI